MQQPILSLSTFGNARTHLEASFLEEGEKLITQWDGALPRSLFHFFVDRGVVSRNDVFDTFWPELSVKEATNVFHVTKKKIKDVTGLELVAYNKPTRLYWLMSVDHPSVIERNGQFILTPADNFVLRADFVDLSIAHQRMLNGAATIEEINKTLLLYKGAYLPFITMVWAKQRRDAFSKMASDMWVFTAQHAYSFEQQFARASQAMQVADMPREDAMHLALNAAVMAFSEGTDMRREALELYRKMAQTLPQGASYSEATMQLVSQLQN